MKCANPLCQTESLYFRSGSLHCIDRFEQGKTDSAGEQRQIIWLCRECSMRFIVQTWRSPGQQIQPRRSYLPVVSGDDQRRQIYTAA